MNSNAQKFYLFIFIYLSIYLFIHSFIHSFILSFVRSFIYFFICLFVCLLWLFTYLFFSKCRYLINIYQFKARMNGQDGHSYIQTYRSWKLKRTIIRCYHATTNSRSNGSIKIWSRVEILQEQKYYGLLRANKI